MWELLQYKFFIHALLAAMLASISCGIIGTYVVSRRMVFIGGGISHASFGGIGIGYYLGIDPLIGAACFAVAAALGIEVITKKSEIREDSAIGIFWSFGMAVGIIFIYLTPGYAPDLTSYLFGSILTVSRQDLYMMAALDLTIILIFLLLFKEILFLAFDEEFVQTRGIPGQLLNSILLCLVALTVVLSIRVVGVILVISLLTIPQAIANLFSHNFRHIIFWAIIFAFLASIGGLLTAYWLKLPSGACIIFLAVSFHVVCKIGRAIYIHLRIRQQLAAN